MFWLSAALGALTWLLSWRILPADRPRHGPAAPFDGQGALWLALALVCYALAGAAGFTLSGLAWLAAQGQGHFGQPPLADSLWLLLAGPFTAVPLLWLLAIDVTLIMLGVQAFRRRDLE